MIRSGEFTYEHVKQSDGKDVHPNQLQPNGVELTIDSIYEIHGVPYIGDSSYDKGNRVEVEPASVGMFSLDEGYYIVSYNERISIPEGHVGYVVPRSRFMRSGAMLYSALWDTGYTGKGEGGLETFLDVEIETGCRIGQMVLISTDGDEGEYDGTHQGENL